jgi:hypothetical protein
MRGDLFVPEPTNPALANTDVTWFDTETTSPIWRNIENASLPDMEGFIGELLFNQAVTLFVETSASATGTLHPMNNSGAGDVIPANTPTPVRVGFLGKRTRLRLRTGGTAPTLWHANGRATSGKLGGPATGTISWGLPPSSPGPVGPAGADAVGAVTSVTASTGSPTLGTGLKVDNTDPHTPVVGLDPDQAVPLNSVMTTEVIAGSGALGSYADLDWMTAANLPAFTSNGVKGPGHRLTINATGALAIDGGSPSVGQRVGVNNVAGSSANQANIGAYVVITAGDGSTQAVLERATDMDEPAECLSHFKVNVINGTANAGKSFYTSCSQGNGQMDSGTAGVNIGFNSYPGNNELGGGSFVIRDAIVMEGNARAPAIADPTGGSTIDVEARAAITALLTMNRARGDIAT